MGSGRAAGPVMREVSTRTAPPRERFDYWRSEHGSVDLSLTDRTLDIGGYDARALIDDGDYVALRAHAHFTAGWCVRDRIDQQIQQDLG